MKLLNWLLAEDIADYGGQIITAIMRITFALMVVIFVCFMLLTSCVTQKRCFDKYPPSRDTTYIEKIKEVKVPIAGDTVSLIVPIKCPDQDIASIENSRLKQVIRILNGKLSSITEIKPDTIIVNTTEIKTVVKEVSNPEKFIPKPVQVLAWFGASCILLILACIAWKIFKPKL